MKLEYAVVFERGQRNYSAYVPDLPGCITTGGTWEEMQEMIREAIAFHIEGMMMDGDPVPQPMISVEDAVAHRNQPLDPEIREHLVVEFGEIIPSLETRVSTVVVEVQVPETT